MKNSYEGLYAIIMVLVGIFIAYPLFALVMRVGF